MVLRKNVIYILVFLCPILFFGQLRVSKHIQDSKISSEENNSLYFIDFWATWCGPCIHVVPHLESLQQERPNNFHILSLSQENDKVISKFLEKHKTRLAIASDYDGETFKKYTIKSLPYGVLVNAYGEKLWEGHPAELKIHHIDKFLKAKSEKVQFKTLFKEEAYENRLAEKKYEPEKDLEYFEVQGDFEDGIEILDNPDFLQLTGSLQDILAYGFNACKAQVIIPESINKSYKILIKNDTKSYRNMPKKLVKALKLDLDTKKIKGDVLVMNTDNTTLWDTNQIDWGIDTHHFLIGNADIKADNVSLEQIKYRLSNLLELPIVVTNKSRRLNKELHDWDVHYKYFELMLSNLKDNYGIEAKKVKTEYLQYKISL